MTKRVSVPGKNVRSSQCGIFLNSEKPRIRKRPSSALMWMSFIPSGVKMLDDPRRYFLLSAGCLAWPLAPLPSARDGGTRASARPFVTFGGVERLLFRTAEAGFDFFLDICLVTQ